MARVLLSSAADREFRKLPKAARSAIANALLGEFTRDPLSPALDIKKLRTPFPGYRLRVGLYRILFTLADGEVRIYSIRHRKDAYR